MTAAKEVLEVQVDEVMRLIRERDMALRQRDQARRIAAELWDENVHLQACLADRELAL